MISMGAIKGAVRYLNNRRFELRCSCRIYPGGEILEGNHNLRHSITVGPSTHIRGQLLTFGYGGRISMGSYCYLGENSKVWSTKQIVIGDRVLIAHNTSIFDSDTHPLNPRKRHEHFVQIISDRHPSHIDLGEEAVTIEDDAWIGCNVVVLKGVTIGRAAIVGAGSVVTKNIPRYVLVAGNPAQVVRELRPHER